MKRKFRPLWRWFLVLAVLVNTVAPVWAAAAMASGVLQTATIQSAAAADDTVQHASSSQAANGCESGSAGQGGVPADHEGCDCDATGACSCPCTLSLKLIDMRVGFAARHLLSTVPAKAAWESVEPGPLASLLRPPIA
jgi:hypothetical protein